MLKKGLFLYLILSLSWVASAKTYFVPEEKSALIYFMTADDAFNALYCYDVQESELKTIEQALNRSAEQFDSSKCQKLSEKGVSQKDISTKLPKLKEEIIKVYSTLNAMMVATIEEITKDVSVAESVEVLFTKLTDSQKMVIESMTSEDIFYEFTLQAKSPVIEVVNFERLEEELESFLHIANL